MGSIKFGGVWFFVYSNDHLPRHVHGFTGEVEIIVEIGPDRSVALANRKDAVRPMNAKRSDIKKILRSAVKTYGRLMALSEQTYGKS